MIVKTRDVIHETHNVKYKTRDVIVKTHDVTIKTLDVIVNTNDVTYKTRDVAQKERFEMVGFTVSKSRAGSTLAKARTIAAAPPGHRQECSPHPPKLQRVDYTNRTSEGGCPTQ